MNQPVRRKKTTGTVLDISPAIDDLRSEHGDLRISMEKSLSRADIVEDVGIRGQQNDYRPRCFRNAPVHGVGKSAVPLVEDPLHIREVLTNPVLDD